MVRHGARQVERPENADAVADDLAPRLGQLTVAARLDCEVHDQRARLHRPHRVRRDQDRRPLARDRRRGDHDVGVLHVLRDERELAAVCLFRQLLRVAARGLRVLADLQLQEFRPQALHLLLHRGADIERRHHGAEAARRGDRLAPRSAEGWNTATSAIPSRHSRVSSLEGGCTLRTTSLCPKTSAAVATTVAPAARYAASSNEAASPAARSTSTVRPDFASRPATSGVRATRRSLATVSFGTPIFIPALRKYSARGGEKPGRGR